MVHYTPPTAFEDKEFKVVLKAKEIHGGNWHDFFLDLSREYYNREVNGKGVK